MNRIRIHLILLSLLMTGIACYSQSPNLISYQTVIRNGNNELVSNTTIGVRISILGGPEANVLVYQEEHTVKTNINGLAYLTIGNGKILNGLITSIDWSKGPYFIKSETDPTGGKNYTIVVLSQMLSVPYAIYSSTAERITGTLPEKDPLFNGSIAKGITSTDTSYWNKKLNTSDTSRMLANYLKKSEAITTGGVETDPVFNGSIAKGITSTDTSYWNKKLNTSDTSGMLANYRTSLNQKLNITDTTKMLVPYLRDADTTNMLANYRTSINNKLDAKDTTLMLSSYLKKSEAVTSGGIETDPLFNESIAKGITATDTSYWNKKLNTSDTSGMLANYRISINNKLDAKDTTLMLSNYLKKSEAITTGGVETDPVFNGSIAKGITATDTSFWNRKLNTSDTSRMLSNYLKKSEAITTGGVEADPVFNVSIAKGITATDTSYWNKKLNTADTSGMLTSYRTGLNQKLNITDTFNMMTPYLRDADTTNMLANYRISINNKLDAKDTTSMLSNYLMKSEAITTGGVEADPVFNGSIAKGITATDTSNWNKKLNTADTTLMLNNYRISLNQKINVSDTANMLAPYLRKTQNPSIGVLTYFDGVNWINLPPGQNGQFLQINNGIPTWSGATYPTLVTGLVSSVKQTTATLGGTISNDGGASINERGIVYGTSPNPTTSSNKIIVGSGIGSFNINLSSLTPNTTYYVRAYANNSAGTAYGNERTFTTVGLTLTDIVGNIYPILQIGNQVWMIENLKTTSYRNGVSIPNVEDNTIWSQLITGAWSYYNNDSNNNAVYGKIYNWYSTIGDILCPIDWHVPTDTEWTTLATYLGGENIAGGKLKSTGTAFWISPNTGATNESNFNVLPAGIRSVFGGFIDIKRSAFFWSATDNSFGFGLNRPLYYDDNGFYSNGSGKALGTSIRCLKD